MKKHILLSLFLALVAFAGIANVNYSVAPGGDSLRTGIDITRGAYTGITVVHKFGRNEAVGTSVEPICLGGNYRTPTALTSLEVLSDSVADDVASTGARKVKIQGLSTGWALLEEEVEMDGTTPVALANQYYRIFRVYVTESGAYATQAGGSHAGKLTIREAGAGQTWVEINEISVFAKGQSQIGAYTVPTGYTAYIKSIWLHVDANQPASIFLFQRQNADDVVAPFDSMRLVQQWDGVQGQSLFDGNTPLGPFPARTDIGFMAVTTAGSAKVAVDFEIILVQE